MTDDYYTNFKNMDQTIQIILNKGTPEQELVSIDARIINFGVELLHGDHSEAYELPQEAATTSAPFLTLQEFMEAHSYSPLKIKVQLPLSTNIYENIVDPITYKCLSRFADLANAEEANNLLTLAKFLNFTGLYNAVGSAISTNFYVGEDDKEAAVLIDKMSSEQLMELMDQHRPVFDRIWQRAKQEPTPPKEEEDAKMMEQRLH